MNRNQSLWIQPEPKHSGNFIKECFTSLQNMNNIYEKSGFFKYMFCSSSQGIFSMNIFTGIDYLKGNVEGMN